MSYSLDNVLDALKDPDSICRGCLGDHADDIVYGPFLGGPVNPDAISEIGSNGARGGLMRWIYSTYITAVQSTRMD